MQQWRVGTITLGVLLIVLGIIFLFSLINGISFVEYIFTWWPFLLILLGLEVLVLSYISNKKSLKIKYDFLSFFMIVFITFLSIGIYSLNSIGIIPRLATLVSSESFNVFIPEQSFNINENINKIIIQAPDFPINVKSINSDKVTILGDSNVYAETQEEADYLINTNKVSSTIIENTIIIQFGHIPRMDDFRTGIKNLNYTLIIPNDIDVELSNDNSTYHYSLITIDIDDVASNWVINGDGPVELNINDNSNLLIRSISRDKNRLNGNWEITDIKNDTDNISFEGLMKFGEGKYNINVLIDGDITVNAINKN